MSETATDIDFQAHYTVAGSAGIAYYLLGYATETTEESWEYIGGPDDDTEDESNYLYNEPEEVEDRQRVRAVMVGDDRVFEVDVEDLTLLGEEDFCRGCGQVGCGCEVWS